MALSTGARLGPYEIVSALGAGGMGEVYRARDTRLDRTVAIKVLSSNLTANADLKARFEREARAIAQLNHPNICVLHDVGSEFPSEPSPQRLKPDSGRVGDGTAEAVPLRNQSKIDFLVMEYLEGESLHDRLKRGPLATEQVLKIAVEIADALEKAHRAGIIHRDLKPGNVMLTKAGAKLLDFGLAKPVGAMAAAMPGSGQSQSVFAAAMTMTSPASPMSPVTSAGSIVGTVQYMSPEQIEGREADARSDIFAFGLMLYEMTAGKRAFEGKTQASIVASILALDPPPITSVKPDVPAPLANLIHTCITKDAEERFQSAHDLKLQLELLASISAQPTKTAASTVAKPWMSRAQWAAIGALMVLAGAATFGWWQVRSEPKPVLRSYITAPDKFDFNMQSVALSPDGRMLVFSAGSPAGAKVLWVRPLNSLMAQALAGTEGAEFPFWSPDSKHIGYFAGSKLHKVEATGGPPQTICDSGAGRGGAWNADGQIVFSPGPNDPLMQVSATGGSPTTVIPVDARSGENSLRWPQFLPDGKHLIFFSRSSAGADKTGISVGTLGSPEHRLIVSTAAGGMYANGYLIYVREQTLVAQPFSTSRLETTGEAVPLAEGVGVSGSIYHALITASQTGMLGYFAGESVNGWSLMMLDASGKLGEKAFPAIARYTWPSFSPDGKRIAVSIMENAGGAKDLWVIDVQRATRTRLTFDSTGADSPLWSADGAKIFYQANVKGTTHIFARASNGSTAQPETILETDGVEEFVASPSRDGRYLAYTRQEAGKKLEVWLLPLFGDRKPYPVVQGGHFNAAMPMISPNGKWVAYISDESGHYEVYVSPITGGAKWQVSTNSGANALWSPDGKRLYFIGGAAQIDVVDVQENGNAIELGTPQTFAPFSSSLPTTSGPIAISPSGRILVNGAQIDSSTATRPMTLVTNWTAELKK